MSHPDLTVLVIARPGVSSVADAVQSCVDAADCTVLLIDDTIDGAWSDGSRWSDAPAVSVIRPSSRLTMGGARQLALSHVTTRRAVWLDAADTWTRDRSARLRRRLDGHADVAIDAEAPPWMAVPGGSIRLVERNVVAGNTAIAFDVERWRRAGPIDGRLDGAELYDLLLRLALSGARLQFSGVKTLRPALATGVGINSVDLRAATAGALRRHAYDTVRAGYREAGCSGAVTAWALASIAMFRDDPAAALSFVDEAASHVASPDVVLEPEGPWPYREGWRRAFQRGTALLAIGGCDAAAASELRRGEVLEPTPEGANNLGAALARLGRPQEAAELFEAALERFPGYGDATANLSGAVPVRITTHPLRTRSAAEATAGRDGRAPRPRLSPIDGLPLPPAELQYHVFSKAVSDEEFVTVGQGCAASLEQALARHHLSVIRFRRVLDFGCGSARVLRSYRSLFDAIEFHGTDVASSVIDWDRAHIDGARFHVNGDAPPLPFDDEYFDYVWSISVFSHLPEESALAWLAELRRVLKPGGVALLTVHGEFRFGEDSTNGFIGLDESEEFEQRGFTFAKVYRDRLFPDWYQNAYMKESYARRAYGKLFDVLDYVPRGMVGRQDVVVVRRPLE